MNLNINEQLMIDTRDANLCIFIANLATWQRTNASKLHKPLQERNFYEGRYWSYNSIQGFVKFFGFWSTQNIKTIIKKAISEGLVITNTFNKKKFDNTLWYSLTDKGLEYYPQLRDITLNTLVNSNKPLVRSNNAIPELPTTGSNNTITTDSDSAAATKSKKTETAQLIGGMIQVYREEFPDNPQPHKTLLSTSLEKILSNLIKRWPEADPNRAPLTLEAFRRYLIALKVMAPNFSLGSYETKSGRRCKNGLETFCRWDNFVKFMEDKYS